MSKRDNWKIWRWIAWHLPRKLVTWAAVRMFAHATSGKYSHTETPALLAVDALERWGER